MDARLQIEVVGIVYHEVRLGQSQTVARGGRVADKILERVVWVLEVEDDVVTVFVRCVTKVCSGAAFAVLFVQHLCDLDDVVPKPRPDDCFALVFLCDFFKRIHPTGREVLHLTVIGLEVA